MAATFTIFALFTTLSCFCLISIEAGARAGFSTDLIHRDSPRSPFYNQSRTRSDRLHAAFRRSVSRASRFSSNHPSDIQSDLTSGSGEYLMKISIGSPPVNNLAIADTGSDLTWIQCQPCTNCYKQNYPYFDPKKSSTYKTLSCDSKPCVALRDDGTSSCDNNLCSYSISYGDQSTSGGDVAEETFTFGSTTGGSAVVPKLTFGCGHDNQGTFNESSSGIVGLGGGAASLVKQLERSISGKFSYCLVPLDNPPNVSSKINFGSNAVVTGPGVVSTPLVSKSPATFYYVTLESLTVGSKSISFKKSKVDGDGKAAEEGNIIIDSGTTLTLLPQSIYDDLESALIAAIKGKRVSDPQNLFTLCYQSTGDLKVPPITAHFTGADIVLLPTSTFLEVEEGITCLTMIPTTLDLAIWGNLSQMDFLIGYDLVKQEVSFKPTDCSKQ
ncbi:hypothetical protein RJ640_029703 [Escallonia rubra]|uniref:Peptidase A1 domain-containing protein n=1 Tax=Escallonia rubra TaxID=112253 RepID=A0AA88QMZ3_9ASTE|nr:hypothetical protein RJ640_029703 [Escallonia rubra]